ncbi:hypothetical protein CK203_076523 [Vitis vinifera]|uniref:Uncharacterized protein n=1 Tax=Vitis vinifera TaxID=29760 RepID=A0A438DB62_VITVI|nr:hypothetical protein CK203_076523 [Vitis vinifera]
MEKASNDEEGSIDGGFNGGWGMLVELDEGNSESTIENGLSSVTDVQNTSSGSSSDTNRLPAKKKMKLKGHKNRRPQHQNNVKCLKSVSSDFVLL